MSAKQIRELRELGLTEIPPSMYPDGWFDPERNSINLNACTVFREAVGRDYVCGKWTRKDRKEIWRGQEPSNGTDNGHDLGFKFRVKSIVGSRAVFVYQNSPEPEPIPF